MGTNIGNLDYISYDSFETESSCLLIPTPDSFDHTLHMLDFYEREYDILEEPLGTVGAFAQ